MAKVIDAGGGDCVAAGVGGEVGSGVATDGAGETANTGGRAGMDGWATTGWAPAEGFVVVLRPVGAAHAPSNAPTTTLPTHTPIDALMHLDTPRGYV